MKKQILLFFLCISSIVYSQKEASYWYFGEGAGIHFNTDGSVTPLTNGKLITLEGCATLSDSNGNLLFYTDGVTVYNKNHQVMLNGTGLKGHWSSSQSATIVPKPSSPNLFYVFTLDDGANVNGVQYSEIDLTLDGGLGGITANKNILVYTPSCEKISVIKHSNNTDLWIVTHGWNSNTFYAHLLTAAGLSATPVASNVGGFIGGTSGGVGQNNVLGYMKISPDGTKLAAGHCFNFLELFDFDVATGKVSNPIRLKSNSLYQFYGVEFSPNSKVLYVAVSNMQEIYQYNLTASNITASELLIGTGTNYLGALQLGPNNKIYLANYDVTNLGVINNPDTVGLGCNLQTNAIDLAGKKSQNGLPCFVQSFFNSSFTVSNQCFGDLTTYSLSGNQVITAATWDFGDGSTSTTISPTHTYTTAGTYTVSVTATGASGTSTNTKDITISAVPTATKPQDLLICDTNNDGLYTFDLTTQTPTILNGQDPNLYSITYFANATDYANKIAIATPNNYANATPYQQQTIIAEVATNANTACKSTTNFDIGVFNAPLPNLPVNIPKLSLCDNTSVGTDTDGRVLFDLTQNQATILNGQLASDFTVSYYKDATLTQNIATPTTYQNTNPTETIYVKMANKLNPACFAITNFSIEVLPLPVVATTVTLKQCDDNIDGFTAFNLEQAIPLVVANPTGVTIAFYKTLTEAQNNTNPILNATTYTNQTVSNDAVFVRVTNANGCFKTAQLNLVVSTTLIPISFQKTFTQCDDTASGNATDGIATFDFSSVTPQVKALYPVGQLLTISYYKNLADALAEKNEITNPASYTNLGYPNTQNIYIRVDSQVNNECLGLGSHITLTVEKIPVVQPMKINHCDDDQDGKLAFDTTNLQAQLLNGLTNVSVTYIDQNNVVLPSPLPNPFATGTQKIKIIVKNTTPTACSYESSIDFIVDDLPEAFPVSTALTTVCDDEADPALQDGKYAFDTSTFQNAILGNQTAMTVNYFDGNNNPLPSPLPNPFITATQKVTAEVVNPINTSCKANTTLAFVVNPIPNIKLLGNELVCSDNPSFTKVINAGLLDTATINNFTYTWFLDDVLIPTETNYSLTVNKQGVYKVVIKNVQGCFRIRTITVTASDIATIKEVKITDLSDNNTILILVSGQGNYVYSLDNQFFQESNTFSNIEAGIYTVYVKDINGCGVATQEVNILGVPKYFTPNGDGYNDYWNIKGVNTTFNANTIIQIFDRYGKLLKQISPTSQGWDGTFNGEPLPATDYWYNITLGDGRDIKGHFALKR